LLVDILNTESSATRQQSVSALANLVSDESVQRSWMRHCGSHTHILVKCLVSGNAVICGKALEVVCALCVDAENVRELLRCEETLPNMVRMMEDATRHHRNATLQDAKVSGAVLALRRMAEFEEGRTLIRHWKVMEKIDVLMKQVRVHMQICLHAVQVSNMSALVRVYV
jgi:hypothetical protein